jgi:hypothetical protein
VRVGQDLYNAGRKQGLQIESSLNSGMTAITGPLQSPAQVKLQAAFTNLPRPSRP